MWKKILDGINEFICYIKKNRKIKPKGKIVKVNLACGYTAVEGWINIDVGLMSLFAGLPKFILKLLYKIGNRISKISKREEEWVDMFKNVKFVHHNLRYGIPIESNSVDYLYTSHFLEHLSKAEAKKFIKEMYRVLKKGGVVRICVPDLEYTFLLYTKGMIEESLKLFFLEEPEKYSKFDIHKYMYNYELLEKFLKEAGFKKITKRKFKKGLVPDIDKLDNRAKETLFVEAKK